ncbi:MAG: hypothetical protein NWF05_08490 [Candidatus Bathyarchaeota archaeon]|nr:hypothetical protein [Candidatus Bathyarchaeota archaeon]
MARYEGTCPECKKTLYACTKGAVCVCDCWQHCPVCGAEMTPYTPDLAMNSYGLGECRDLTVLMVCMHHSPIFFSSKRPVEVVCT